MPFETFNTQLNKMITGLERWLWPSRRQGDCNVKTLFIYKEVPKQLKSHEVDAWVALQIKTQCPFVNGYHFSYMSAQGLHLWFSATAFNGPPETAMQSPLSDGSHLVKGATFYYAQHWVKGNMISCEIVSEGNSGAVLLDDQQPWAMESKIRRSLTTPLGWFWCFSALLLCILTWYGVGMLTLALQEKSLQAETQTLSDQVGDKLQKQSQLQSQQLQVDFIENWLLQYGQLPESLGMVADKVNQQGAWQVRQINWQNATLELELSAENLDIASLVSEIETLPFMQRVSIRPFTAGGAWIIEAKSK
ncbi:hypothetical protein [Bowmanella denitrificans]|uniref:hypothetical protein n=1 Tax=Bowmanella denitrificans TaxID=366582 RepID=UPI000C9A7C1A|nr:hypothetical protein [Bowmanella denitrificans]